MDCRPVLKTVKSRRALITPDRDSRPSGPLNGLNANQ
jgi:hypothetical protein